MKIYTKKGDDGTTGLYFGGRVSKASAAPMAYGAVDEAQAYLGVARAEAGKDHELHEVLLILERNLWVLMAELATEEENLPKLEEGVSKVTQAMVDQLEAYIDSFAARFELPKEFVVPGETKLAAYLDVARAQIRRAERDSVQCAPKGSLVLPYLNRLSDLVWTLARFTEGHARTVRSVVTPATE